MVKKITEKDVYVYGLKISKDNVTLVNLDFGKFKNSLQKISKMLKGTSYKEIQNFNFPELVQNLGFNKYLFYETQDFFIVTIKTLNQTFFNKDKINIHFEINEKEKESLEILGEIFQVDCTFIKFTETRGR